MVLSYPTCSTACGHDKSAAWFVLRRERKGLVLSSVANLVHLYGEDMGSNPAWKISCH